MTSALLVLDYQVGVVARHGVGPDLLERATSAIAVARGARMPIVYVRVAFRPGYPDVSDRNRALSRLVAAGPEFSEDHPATQIHPQLRPRTGDIVCTKRRVSAFAGTDLDVVLRSRQVDSLVLFGIATSGVVLSTLREAADRDYDLTVLADVCADRDEEVHRVLTTKVFTTQAAVTTVAEWSTRSGSR